jgi:hypothetical protein
MGLFASDGSSFNSDRRSHGCCGVVSNGCCDVSAPRGTAFKPSAVPLLPPKPAIACTSEEVKPSELPIIAPVTRTAIRHAYMAGDVGLRSVAQQFGVGVETVRRCLSEPGRPAGHSIGGAL